MDLTKVGAVTVMTDKIKSLTERIASCDRALAAFTAREAAGGTTVTVTVEREAFEISITTARNMVTNYKTNAESQLATVEGQFTAYNAQ